MDISKIITLVIGLLGSSGQIAEIVKLVMQVVGKIIPLFSPPTVTEMDVAWVQRALAKVGFDPGPIDGAMGPTTQKAIIAYQTARGLDPDGWMGAETQTKLRMEAGDA